MDTEKDVSADIAVIGLAVMGKNLILNMNDHGLTVAVYNRTVSKVHDFINGEANSTNIIGTQSIKELVSKLKKPRRVMLMVKAGDSVDQTIEQLIPHLEPGDVIIDGGNSLFKDTARRVEYVESKGLLYIGTGVSGGEEGARRGPSIMPGGSSKAWEYVKDIFQAISAKVEDGSACCEWVGEGGAGHYVKMVHNGIEYGDMQLICEAYDIMKNHLGMSHDEMSKTFDEWNKGSLDSYLIQITSEILAYKDKNGDPLVEKILDTAGQKGTGKWTVISSAELGQSASVIAESVYSRCISALKEDRVSASKVYQDIGMGDYKNSLSEQEKKDLLEQIRQALYMAKIISYTQGFMLMREAAKEYSWKLNYGGIALMWRGGCIIRSRFLGDIKKAFDSNPDLSNLLLDGFFKEEVADNQLSLRKIVSLGALSGVPLPSMSAALSFFDSLKREKLPANLLQAQRDYFGAHTYERIDEDKGKFFHTNWTGRGGDTCSSAYDV